MRLTAAFWIAVTAGILVVVSIVRLVFGKRGARRLDAGAVSHQWIAEHRGDPDNTGR
jgi:hypothetical protein